MDVTCYTMGLQRIGNRMKVNILHANWIPRSGCVAPLGATYHPQPTRVADLLNDAGNGWNEALLSQVFTPSDTCDMKNIFVGGRGTEDCRAWKYTKSGSF